jgi:hypothetical protein
MLLRFYKGVLIFFALAPYIIVIVGGSLRTWGSAEISISVCIAGLGIIKAIESRPVTTGPVLQPQRERHPN